jgi:DNA end-binding protein Ku
MTRAIWSGTISFGLVNIAVSLHAASRAKDVRFHEIDRVTGQRIRRQRVRFPVEEKVWFEEPPPSPRLPEQAQRFAPAPPEVRPEEIVKGYEVAPDTFVTLTEAEIEELRSQRSRTIDIEAFVDTAAVDPAFFDTGYHVAPQRDYERPFALLVETLATSGRLAVCWIVLRKRRHLAALRPHQGLLLLSTMFFADEVVPVGDVAPRPAEKPSERELKLAALLVESMSGEFEPSRYEDNYRKRLLDLFASRGGNTRRAPNDAEGPIAGGVEELMAALEASLEQARKQARKPQRRRTG